MFDPFLTPFRWTHTQATIPRNAAKRAPGGQKPLVAVRLGHSEGWDPPKVGACMREKCPRIPDSFHPARDTAIFWFQPAGRMWGPNEPIWGPTDTVPGPHGSERGQTATQTVPKLIVSINVDKRTFRPPPRRHRGLFLVIFGPAWGPNWGPPPGTATRGRGALWRPGHGPSRSQR